MASEFLANEDRCSFGHDIRKSLAAHAYWGEYVAKRGIFHQLLAERKAERKACGKPREDSEKELLRQLQEVRAPETKRRVHWRVAGMHGRRHC
jgi:hypothetical protein